MFRRASKEQLTEQDKEMAERQLLQGQIAGLEWILGAIIAHLNDADLNDKLQELFDVAERSINEFPLSATNEEEAKRHIAFSHGVLTTIRHIVDRREQEKNGIRSVNWGTCTESGQPVWCPLNRLNLSAINSIGVYVIWDSQGVLYVGQGNIADQLREYRSHPAILNRGDVGVTWINIPDQNDRDGIERFLSDYYRPRLGENHPNVTPIPVSLPW